MEWENVEGYGLREREVWLVEWVVREGSKGGCSRLAGCRCGPGRGNERLDVYVSVIEPSSASQAPVFKIRRGGGGGGG